MPTTIYGEYQSDEIALWRQGKLSSTDPTSTWNGRTVTIEHSPVNSSIQDAFADLGSLEEGDCPLVLTGEEAELLSEGEEIEIIEEGESEWTIAPPAPFYSYNDEENLTVAEILARRGMAFDYGQGMGLAPCKSLKKHVKQIKHSTGKGIRKCKRFIVKHKKPIIIGATVVAVVVVSTILIAGTAGTAAPAVAAAASAAGSAGVNRASSKRREEDNSSPVSFGADPGKIPSSPTIAIPPSPTTAIPPSPRSSYSQEYFNANPLFKSSALSSYDISAPSIPMPPLQTQNSNIYSPPSPPISKPVPPLPTFGSIQSPIPPAAPTKIKPPPLKTIEGQLREEQAFRIPLPPKTDGSGHVKASIGDVILVPQNGVRLISITGLSKDKTDRIALGLDPMKLEFSYTELMSGEMYIDDHFKELLPKKSTKIGLVALGNGINTSPKEFLDMSAQVHSEIPGKPLFIALYNPSEGIIKDIPRALKEMYGGQTPNTETTRRFMIMISKRGEEVNDQFHWVFTVHSEAGAIECRAVDGMSRSEKDRLQKQLHVIALGPARPISKRSAFDAVNIYSSQDGITLPFAIKYLNDPDYEIRIVPCISTWDQKSLYLFDHALNPETTYYEALKDNIRYTAKEQGFYDGKETP